MKTRVLVLACALLLAGPGVAFAEHGLHLGLGPESATGAIITSARGISGNLRAPGPTAFTLVGGRLMVGDNDLWSMYAGLSGGPSLRLEGDRALPGFALKGSAGVTWTEFSHDVSRGVSMDTGVYMMTVSTSPEALDLVCGLELGGGLHFADGRFRLGMLWMPSVMISGPRGAVSLAMGAEVTAMFLF